MKISLPRLLLLSALLVLSPGCGKKQPKNATSPEQQNAAAAASTAAGEDTAASSGTDAASTETAASGDGAEAPAPVQDPAMAGVPAELLASDQAYESWFKTHRLDLNDPKMLEADEDNDGSNNRDEFLANTDPRDPNSRPGVHATIRLKDYSEANLPLIVEAVEGSTARIRRTDGDSTKSETVRAGETVRGTNYKVERVASRRDVDKHGDPTDRSQVVLSDTSTREKVVLVKDMPTRSSATFATIVSNDGKKTRKVKQGEGFSWPEEGGTSYKVVDLREDQVVVQEVDTNKTWTIPRE